VRAQSLDECFRHTRLILDSMELHEQRRGKTGSLNWQSAHTAPRIIYQWPFAARSGGGLENRRLEATVRFPADRPMFSTTA
jgi:hypothetical protein